MINAAKYLLPKESESLLTNKPNLNLNKLNLSPNKPEKEEIPLKKISTILSDNTSSNNNQDSERLLHNNNKISALSNNLNQQLQHQENQKLFVIKKLNLPNKSEIKNLIEKKFTDVNEFLVPDENIIIGRKFLKQSENFKNLANKKPYEIIGNLKQFEPKNRFSFFKKGTNNRRNMEKTRGIFSNLLMKYLKPLKSEENQVEVLTERKIEDLFEEKKKMKSEKNENNFNNKINNECKYNYNSSSTNNNDYSFYKNIDNKCQEQVKFILEKQEKILEKRNKTEKSISNISKHLSLKTNKSENQLLMNNTEGFRLKNELQTALDQRAQNNSKYGLGNDWLFSLRKTPQINCAKNFIFSKEMESLSPKNSKNLNNNNNKNDNYNNNNNDYYNINSSNKILNINSSNNTNSNFFSFNKNKNNSNINSNNNNTCNNNNSKGFDSSRENGFMLSSFGNLSASTGSNFYSTKNKSSNHYTNNFSNTNDEKFRIMKYKNNKYYNDMWVTVSENNDCFSNKNSKLLFKDQVRKPFSDPVSSLDNFTKCFAIENKMKNLKIRKEDLNKINNMKIEGNDLLEFEIEHIKKLTGKKVLLKDTEEKNSDNDYYQNSYNYSELIKQTKIK